MPNFNYPMTAQDVTPANTANGDFQVGHWYVCTSVNAKAKPGADGQPRFTVGMAYLCIRNGTSTSETSDIPPTFLVDNGYAAVNCGRDAKLKTTFRAA